MRWTAVVLLGLPLAGCFSLGGSSKPVEVRSFDLQPPMPSPVPPDAAGAESLWVEPFSVDPALDRREIVWRRGGGEAGAWDRYSWARPPAEAVRSVLADALVRCGTCAVVATEPRIPDPEYVLRGHLARFEEVDGEKEWSGVLEIRVVLVRTVDGEEILRRTYSGTQKAAARNPGAVVLALRAGLESAAKVFAEDIAEALEAERERGAK